MHLKVAAAVLALMLLETTIAENVRQKSSFYVVPRHQKTENHTVSNERQGTKSIFDIFMDVLPMFNTQNSTKGTNGSQIQQLENVFKIFTPVLNMFLEPQTKRKSPTPDANVTPDEVRTFPNYLNTSLLEKSNSQPSESSTRELLPDYTDHLTTSNLEESNTHTSDYNTRESLPDYTYLLENFTPLPNFNAANSELDLPTTEPEPKVDSFFEETFQLYKSFPDIKKQTQASISPSLKPIVVRPAKRRFSGLRDEAASQQMTRTGKSPSITTWDVNNFGSSFTEENEGKESRNTQAFRRQPSEQNLRSSTSKRRQVPSRLLRQQIFGSYQPSSPSTDTPFSQHVTIPLARSGLRRMNILRRRRLTTPLP